MDKYLKFLLVVFILVLGLSACKAEEKQGTMEEVTQQESDVNMEDNEVIPEPEWITDYQKAIAISKETGKTIFVNFTGSDWCIWCVRLKNEVFKQQEFKDYADANLVLLELDFPRNLPQTEALKKQNNELLGKFKVNGFPTIVLLNSKGEEINRTGYQQGGPIKYVEHLQELLKK